MGAKSTLAPLHVDADAAVAAVFFAGGTRAVVVAV